ncbi:MAG: SDR family NAD(P)-dependent oxidoreductase [Propionibacteriaceae bacterium]
MRDLTGAVVLVVGASGALGQLVARSLAGHGARVVAAGRDRQRLEALEIEGARTEVVDLRDPAFAEQLLDRIGDGLVGTVYAAGVVGFGPVGEVDDDDVDELLLINFLAPSRLVRAALPRLPRGGFAATISAVVAEAPPARMAHYAASKAAMTAFDTSVRLEARRSKITIMDLRPPHTETGLVTRAITGEPPKLPPGLHPQAVADRIVTAVLDDEPDVASTAF